MAYCFSLGAETGVFWQFNKLYCLEKFIYGIIMVLSTCPYHIYERCVKVVIIFNNYLI